MTLERKFEAILLMILAAVAFESTCAPTIDNSVIPNLDKMIHFAVFGCMAWLLASILEHKAWFHQYAYAAIAMLSIVIVALLGAADEYLQSFTATRHAELDDVYADIAGAMFFLLVWIVLKHRLKSGNAC